MRYRLRTLLILLAVVPPLLAGAWCGLAQYLGNRDVEWEEIGGPGSVSNWTVNFDQCWDGPKDSDGDASEVSPVESPILNDP